MARRACDAASAVRSAAATRWGRSYDREEPEVPRQQDQEVEDHREPDRRDEQPADEGDGPAVAGEEPDEPLRAVIERRDHDERNAEAEGVADEQQRSLELALGR